MKKARFTESQIVAILKEADAGLPVGDLIRKHGISSASYYKWKAKYGGLDASELKRIKELEAQLTEFHPCAQSLPRCSPWPRLLPPSLNTVYSCQSQPYRTLLS